MPNSKKVPPATTTRVKRDVRRSNIAKRGGSRSSGQQSMSADLASMRTLAGAESVGRMFPVTSSGSGFLAPSMGSMSGVGATAAGRTGVDGTSSSSACRHIDSSPTYMADEGPSPYACTMCSKILGSKTALRNHVAQEHEGKNVAKCPHCAKAFTRPSQLRKHISVTHDERTGEFYCDKCEFKNREAELFNQHMRTHNRCQYCRNEFPQLSRHQSKCPFRP